MRLLLLFLSTISALSGAAAATTIYCENSNHEKLYLYMDETSLQMNLTDRQTSSELAKMLPEQRHRFPLPKSTHLTANVKQCMKVNGQLTCQILGGDYWEVFNSIGKLSARGAGVPAILRFDQQTSVFTIQMKQYTKEIRFQNSCRFE